MPKRSEMKSRIGNYTFGSDEIKPLRVIPRACTGEHLRIKDDPRPLFLSDNLRKYKLDCII